MKYSSHCNEGCIDLNRRALLKAPASANEKEQEEWKVSSDHHSVFYQHRVLVLVTNCAPQRKLCLGGDWGTFIQQIRNMQPVIMDRCCSFLHHLWTFPWSAKIVGYIIATCCSESMSCFIQEPIYRLPHEKQKFKAVTNSMIYPPLSVQTFQNMTAVFTYLLFKLADVPSFRVVCPHQAHGSLQLQKVCWETGK